MKTIVRVKDTLNKILVVLPFVWFEVSVLSMYFSVLKSSMCPYNCYTNAHIDIDIF